MTDLMIVEIQEDNEWVVKSFEDIEIGSLFRLRNPNSGELHVFEGQTEFKATSGVKMNQAGILYVDIEEVGDRSAEYN